MVRTPPLYISCPSLSSEGRDSSMSFTSSSGSAWILSSQLDKSTDKKKTISQFLENSMNTIVWSNYIHIIPLFPTISWQTRSNCNGPTDWVYRLIFPLLKAEKLGEHLENLFENSCKPCLYNIWGIINDQIKCIKYIFCQCIAKNFSRRYFIYYHNIFAEKRAKWPCYFITCRC